MILSILLCLYQHQSPRLIEVESYKTVFSLICFLISLCCSETGRGTGNLPFFQLCKPFVIDLMSKHALTNFFSQFPRISLKRGPQWCIFFFPFQLTVSYEVPQILSPVASVSILNLLQKLLGCTETGMDSMACGIFGILLCGHFGFRFHGLFGTVLDRWEWECTDLQKNHGSNLPSSCVNPQVWILPGTFPSKIFLCRTSDLLISMEISPHKHAYALIPWNIEDPSACKFSSCIN